MVSQWHYTYLILITAQSLRYITNTSRFEGGGGHWRTWKIAFCKNSNVFVSHLDIHLDQACNVVLRNFGGCKLPGDASTPDEEYLKYHLICHQLWWYLWWKTEYTLCSFFLISPFPTWVDHFVAWDEPSTTANLLRSRCWSHLATISWVFQIF